MDAPLHGAWLRTGISRDGGPLRETEHVVWVQTDTLYADSRGFAGTTSYDGRRVTFHHHVGAPGHDVGVLRPDGNRLVEMGTNPDGSTFLEVWSPLPYAQGPTGCWFAAGTQTVRVGCHVVHVDAAGHGTHHVLLRTDPVPSGPPARTDGPDHMDGTDPMDQTDRMNHRDHRDHRDHLDDVDDLDHEDRMDRAQRDEPA